MIICARKEDLMHKAGVYKITNIETHGFYVGSSKDLWKRYREHNTCLRNNNHIEAFQNDYNTYGSDSFKFEVIEYCDEDIRKNREQIYLDLYKSDDKFYNKANNAYGGTGLTKLSEEHKKHISESVKGKLVGINSPMYGKHLNDEVKVKISQNNIGKHSGADNGMYNCYGAEHPKSKVTYIYDEEGNLLYTFNGLRECVRHLLNEGIVVTRAKDPERQISNYIIKAMKKGKSYKGYIFSYDKI